MEIGKRLSDALQIKDIKTKDLVEKFNITQQYVSNIKKADKINDTIATIANYYLINLNWLISGEGNMFIQKDTQANNFQHSINTGSGVDNSHNKTTHEGTNKTLLCDDITLSIVSELCKIYKDNEGNLQMKLLNMLNDAKPN